MSEELGARGGGVCELCGATEGLEGFPVGPDADQDPDRHVWACGVCRGQAEAEGALDGLHWYCLQGTVWSEVPAVRVLAWRLLGRLSEHPWAVELRDQMDLDDPTRTWATALDEETSTVVVDAHGTPLTDGDSVTLIKDLDVKGAGFTAKRGTLVKNIRLGDDPTHVEGRVNKVGVFLKTCFLKKAS